MLVVLALLPPCLTPRDELAQVAQVAYSDVKLSQRLRSPVISFCGLSAPVQAPSHERGRAHRDQSESLP
jgi:hypothetical protein